MRRRRARLLAVLTGAAVVALSIGFALLRGSGESAAPVDGTQVSRGAEAYARLGCPACHSYRGTGSPSRPLDGVGERLSRDQIRTWIVAPQRMKPGVVKPAYDDVPDGDVDAVVDHLRQP